MKNLYIKCLLSFFTLFFCRLSYSQTYITWNPVVSGGSITGTAGTVGVTGILTAGTAPFSFDSPANPQTNLIVVGANTFATQGPANQVSRDLVITFSQSVVVTRYNMADIDLGTWNDTFNFANINFTNNPVPTSTNCTANLNGAIATATGGSNTSFASWFCSNPITTFTVDYQSTNGLTHATLGYSIEVLIPPDPITDVCLNGSTPIFPSIGNGISGTWTPSTIDTSIAGVSTYVFTPSVGQSIQCPITLDVTVINCCIPTATYTSPSNNITNVSNPIDRLIERGDWIKATNIINLGNSNFQQGVVYHAQNFVELNPGFEAIFGSQFSAYPQGCTNPQSFFYRKASPKKDSSNTEIKVDNLSKQPSVFKINFQSEKQLLNISMLDLKSNNLKVYTLDGKVVYENSSEGKEDYEIDVSFLSKAVYIVSITKANGRIFSEKFIKN